MPFFRQGGGRDPEHLLLWDPLDQVDRDLIVDDAHNSKGVCGEQGQDIDGGGDAESLKVSTCICLLE
jgi:hypothetical protein